MPKRVWVINYKTEDLQSVENISSSLVRLYSSLPTSLYQVTVLELQDAERISGIEWREWIVAFKNNPPDHVAIVHPSVNHHIFFLSMLSLNFSSQLLFHVFGNFFRNGESWHELNRLLEDKKVKMLAASQSYYQVLENFVSKESLSLIPFPLQKISLPESFERDQETLHILYAGRFHEQKNVLLMIEKLAELSVALKKKIQLNLVVVFDDFNPTTLNENKKLGQQFKKYQKMLKTSGNVHVVFHEHMDFESLQRMFKRNDIFISLSTFLDEDYGCAVLESLQCGTPCIVTEWGGYKDFIQVFPEDCYGIKVELEDEAFIADFTGFGDQVIKLAQKSPAERISLANKAQNIYSLDQLQSKLETVFKQTDSFKGFSPRLREFSMLLGKFDVLAIQLFKSYYKSFWKV